MPKTLVGFLLIPLFWFLFAFFAFVPFNRKTSAQRILAVTGAAFLAILILLHRRRLLGFESGIDSGFLFGLMVALYAIPLRGDLPAAALTLNQKISDANKDRYEYARDLFHAIAGRFISPTREYLLEPQKIFLIKSASYYWKHRGYVPSHLQAQLYRRLLLASGRFIESEAVYETGRCYNSPHGYVIIRPECRVVKDLQSEKSGSIASQNLKFEVRSSKFEVRMKNETGRMDLLLHSEFFIRTSNFISRLRQPRDFATRSLVTPRPQLAASEPTDCATSASPSRSCSCGCARK
ncbi:MAG: hypothetical protein DMF58_01155 [Acidobacteria bacterium]|nr:MAG: hypothetical protein DMF58_01155 [Acidobacteriota bacterium]